MKHFFLYLVVSVSGAAVLAIEILGTRILGPFYGVDLFLWSALISVTLAALSLGYMLGGHWADRAATMNRLCTVVLIAGMWIMLIPWIKHPFLALAEPLGLRVAVLVAAFVLFFVPLMLLGTISPYAIKLKISTLAEVGRTAGNLYAISTVASVFSALLTGFFLIPNFGVAHLTLAIGAILVVTALAGFFIQKKSAPVIGGGIILLVIVAIATLWKASAEQPDPARGLLAIEQSPYAELRVLDNEGGRHLLIDGGIHGLVDTSTWRSYFHYAAVLDLPKYFFDKPGSMLLIGLGGGSLVKQYAQDNWRVEAVEIDPKVVEFAQTYFDLLTSDGRIYQMDGRQFLASTKNTYDVILLDAFGSSSIPFHLVTREAFELISQHLNPDGVFGLNVETIDWNDPIIKTLTATLKQEFKEVIALPMEEPPNRFGNMVLLSSNAPLQPKREPERNELLEPDWRFGPGYQKVHAWDNKFTANTENARVLTDDLNPIDIRSQAINLVARKDLHQYFGTSGMSW